MATFGTLDPTSYSLVWRDNFADNSGLDQAIFPIIWGNATDIVSGNGALTITSRASEGWTNAGFIQAPTGVAGGQGYGLYSVTAALGAGEGIGACFGLWPADNVWPGAELDMLESFDATRSSGYSAIHSRAANGGDAYDTYTFATDLTKIHTYSLDWEAGRLTYYIDGRMAYTTTNHLPLDYAHGGVNEAFAAQVTNAGSAPASQSVSLKLYDISYSHLNAGVAVPAPPVAPMPARVEFGVGADTLVLWTTENAYNGDAQYTIKVDGVQVGGIQTAIAWDGAGMGADQVTVHGNWGGGGHVVTLTFLNDAYGGTPAQDRNLYIAGVQYDGNWVAGGALLGNGSIGVAVAGGAIAAVNSTVGSGADQLVLFISQDAWQGNALYTVSVDGVQVGGTLTAHASAGNGAHDVVTLLGTWGGGQHNIALSFLNDAWGGQAGQDRNLHLSGVSYDGVAQANGSVDLMSTGSVTLAVAGGAPTPASLSVGSGAASLLLRVSQDAWHGSAQYTVSVDGVQVGGTLTATALHGSGSDSVTLHGTWGSGSHVVAVTFSNDAWGTGAGADRNLYVEGMSYAGTSSAASANMMSNGTTWFLAGNTSALPAGSNGQVKQGGTGADQLVGTAGNDVLIAGAGNDGLTGGAGNDNFVFTQGDGHDWLNDFSRGSDHLVLKGVASGTVSTAMVTYFGTSGTDVHYGTAGDSVFLANVWSLSGADILFA
jgi:hypothetical protein